MRETRLGEELVRMGVIDWTELRAMLSVQSELRAAHGGAVLATLSGRFRLGRLLVEAGIIDEATLAATLASSRRTGRRLGESLVDAGAISNDVLQRALDRQRGLMAAALSSVALTSPLPAAADTTHVRVAATVMARAMIESQRLPSEVVLSAEDVSRGYVDLPVEIGIRANQDVMLGFWANSRDLAAVDIAAGNARVAQRGPGLRAQTVSLQLRLRLAPGARPGRIAFPVSVSLTPA